MSALDVIMICLGFNGLSQCIGTVLILRAIDRHDRARHAAEESAVVQRRALWRSAA